MNRHAWTSLFILLAAIPLLLPSLAQAKDKARRGEAEEMLKNIAGDVRDHYYDPKLHGIDWDAAVTKAQQQIARSDSFTADMFTIADLVNQLGDSGLRFIPPPHPYNIDFGLAWKHDWRSLLCSRSPSGQRCGKERVEDGR